MSTPLAAQARAIGMPVRKITTAAARIAASALPKPYDITIPAPIA